MSQNPQMQGGPSVRLPPAVPGGVPTVGVDVPILAVFIALYATCAALNMATFQINKRRGHKFLISGALFGFCMARIATCVLRIAWATRQTNTGIALAAQILVNAGILLVYIINLVLAQRILRAKQPQVGWHPVVRHLAKPAYALIAGALAMVITSVVLLSNSTDPNTLRACRDVQLAAITYLLVFTILPLFPIAAAYILPRAEAEEQFGLGSTTSKALILTASTCLAILIAGFKAGSFWEAPRPATNPAWYQSKPSFYVFNFVLEICILVLFLVTRVDKRFHVPDGSKGPGDYSRGKLQTDDNRLEKD